MFHSHSHRHRHLLQRPVSRLVRMFAALALVVPVTGSSTLLHASAAPLSAASPSASIQTRAKSSAEVATGREIIVKFKAAASEDFSAPKDFSASKNDSGLIAQRGIAGAAKLSAKVGKNLRFGRAMSENTHVLQIADGLSDADIATLVDDLNKNASAYGVEYASLNGWRRIAAADAPHVTPDDPRYTEQWHYQAQTASNFGANLPGAWDITTGSPALAVAVLDTGIRFDHPDLAGRTVTGFDFVSNVTAGNDGNGRDNDATDPGDFCNPDPSSWHGTHVAGTIGAATNNSVGVAGINWQSKILPVRVLGKCGGSDSDIIDGMRWAAGLSVSGVANNPNPARVLNLSLGGFSSGCNPGSDPDAAACKCPASFQDAVNQVLAAGAVIAVAAGNENVAARASVPGNCVGVITVAATDKGGDKASYSNFDSSVEIAAPGGETSASQANGVLSTLNDGTTTPGNSNYAFYQGTSMATPHVAGIASLILSIRPSLTPAQVLQIIQSTATAFPNGSGCITLLCGTGIINAAAAVASANGIQFKYAYMPLAQNPAVVVTPPPASIANGNFDAGRDGNWTQYSNSTADIIVSQAESGITLVPHSGTFYAWLGGLNNENGGIFQQVTVSAAAPFLVYYHRIGSADTNCGVDVGRVKINNTAVKAVNLCTTQATGAWVRQSVNLAAFAGQSIKLEFNITTNGALNSNWFIDTVSFSASA